jgi:hypothetical protein
MLANNLEPCFRSLILAWFNSKLYIFTVESGMTEIKDKILIYRHRQCCGSELIFFGFGFGSTNYFFSDSDSDPQIIFFGFGFGFGYGFGFLD